MNASVIGGGSWGTAFARLLANAGIKTELICRRPEQAAKINRNHRNPDYLRHVELPRELTASSFEANEIGKSDLAAVAVPSRAFRDVMRKLAPGVNPQAAVLSLTKGLEPGTLKRFSQVLKEELPAPVNTRVLVLSGPNHAEEVAADIPTASVIAAADKDLACQIQGKISTTAFRVYVNTDIIGVELCAAAKNVIALAAGMSDGLGFGDNAKAALITRGLAEMARLGTSMGAWPGTYSGLAGMGDLIATCTSRHSRNRRAGELIATGMSPEQAEAGMSMVAEGLASAASVRELARRQGVEMPITEQVCQVIYEGKDVRAAVADLMTRAPVNE
ncbi:MAG: NAD(P)-dependent glycerol-3-phosphate dehydrogenase [Thermoleophilia bacterium]|nr:NAD(P)-dependent glycerol-3-phosphate dehydrogenase [Thermoleophilia bacterium]